MTPPLTIRGRSIAGIHTAVEVPELDLLLDLGQCSTSATNYPVVLLSHGHIDHMGAVAQHAARRAMLGRTEAVYVVPHLVAPQVEALFNAAGELDGQSIPRRVVALAPGEEFALGKGRFVRALTTFHVVPSQGYTVWERRQRLREEFRSLPGSKLGELRRAGVTLDEPFDAPLLSFTGDTRVEVLQRNPELAEVASLVIEASFIDERMSAQSAHERGHIHLDDLNAHRDLLPQRDVVLMHFSARYLDAEVPDILRARLADELKARVRMLDNVECTAKPLF